MSLSGRRALSQYKKVDLESASPLRIVLEAFRRIEGDIEEARRAILARDIPAKAAAIDHALALLGELEAWLDHDATPELSQNLALLYRYAAERLLAASVELDVAPLADAERALIPLREAFHDLELRTRPADPTPPPEV